MSNRGWAVYTERSTLAHYVEEGVGLCSGIETTPLRPWGVAQDVGVIGLCEECRGKLHDITRPAPKVERTMAKAIVKAKRKGAKR